MSVSYSPGELYLVYTHRDLSGDTVCTPVAHPIFPPHKRWKIRGAKRSEEQLSIDELENFGEISLITFRNSSGDNQELEPIVIDTITNVDSISAARDVARTWVEEMNQKEFPDKEYDPNELDDIADEIPTTTEKMDERSLYTADSDGKFLKRYQEVRSEIASKYD